MEDHHATPPIAELPDGFRGQTIRPGEPGYDSARSVYNGMIDKRPMLVVRPTGAADVIDAVNLARDSRLPVAVRCGGHSVAGNAVCDGGVLIDLSGLKGVHVDPAARTARANGGALWGEFDRETQLFGLATPGGRVTTTGVGGFTLGGGYGWLSSAYGLACDNLISADVVTAGGRLVTASEAENSDLFWGIRGGSSNFGVVTSYEFKLHPVGPMVLAGLLIHPIEEGPAVMRAYRDYVESAPDELASAATVLLAPPEPFVPPHLHGKPVFGIVVCYAGEVESGRDAVAGLQRIGPPLADIVQPMPYLAFQAFLDPFSPWGWLNYHRGEHLRSLPDAAIDAYLEAGGGVLSPMSQAVMFRTGGAVSRIPDDANAAGHRDAMYMGHPIACWSDPADTEQNLAWVRRFSEALSPFKTGGVYLNFEPDAGEERVRAGYGQEKYAKLVAIKERWDPENIFRINQNIKPAQEVPVKRPVPA